MKTAITTHWVNIWIVVFWFAHVLHNGSQVWESVFHFQDFLQLLIIFHDDDVWLGVVRDIVAGIRGVCRVDTDGETTELSNNNNEF